MAYYDVIKDFEIIDDDVICTSPVWCMAVIRLAPVVSFDRNKQKSTYFNALSDGVRTRDKTLVIVSDCVRLSTYGDKGSHVKNLQATLMPTQNYTVEILPGDWVLAWMKHNEHGFENLLERIRDGKQCNFVEDGLKFVGRIQSIRKTLNTDRQRGTKVTRYEVQATAFRELDSQLFYDEHLANQDKTLGVFFARIGANINSLLTKGAIQTQKAIPTFLEILLGGGVATTFSNPAQIESLRLGIGLPIYVPKEVGDLLGKVAYTHGSVLSWTDMTEMLFGLQRYSTEGEEKEQWRCLVPDGVQNATGQYKFTGKDLVGSFIPVRPNFVNMPIWSVLTQWLNPLVNEMYTAMKVNNRGEVVPTIVLRQVPFTSPILAEKVNQKNEAAHRVANPRIPLLPSQHDRLVAKSTLIPEVTPFHELPRWKIDPALVWQFDLGRSDALRFNFIWVYGAASATQSSVSLPKQIVRSPPVRDDLDIHRSGVRAYSGMVNCSIQEEVEGPAAWMEFAADYLMGQHLTYTGTLNCLGIEAPIAEGDNLEFDGIVFHIETITNECSISPGGEKSFVTSLNLTHGMRADHKTMFENKPWAGTADDAELFAAVGAPVTDQERLSGFGVAATEMYPGLSEKDNRTYEPGLTVEDTYNG